MKVIAEPLNGNPNPSISLGPVLGDLAETPTDSFLRAIIDPVLGCAEIRVLEATVDPRSNLVVPAESYTKTIAVWVDDPELLRREASRIRGVSAYITVNPVNPDLKARANKLGRAKSVTADKDIVRLRYLFLDFDAKRPSGISSTIAELTKAGARLGTFLADNPEIEPSCLWGCSGNGYWCLVRLPDYPNDEEHRELIERATDYFGGRYSDADVEVDPATKNPARVMPLVGTMKCKGVSTEDRPHRMVTMESPVGRECPPFDLRAFIDAEAPVSKPEPRNTRANATTAPAGCGDAEKRARAYVFSSGFPDSIDGEKGHGRLYHTACELIDGFGLTESQALPIFRDWNAAKASPPEDEKQVIHKIRQAIKNHPVPSLKRLNAPMKNPTATAKPAVNGFMAKEKAQAEEDAKLDDLLAAYKPKTFGTIAKSIGELEHLWENWLILGNVSMIWSKPKIGKTRVYIGLIKYLWFATTFPDGAANRCPEGTKTLVIPYDRNHSEIHNEMRLAGIPDGAAVCPYDPRDETGVSLMSLTDPYMLRLLEKIVEGDRAIKLIVIDTLTYASEKSLSKPEDMKAILDGIMELAARHKIAVLILIHENKEGGALGVRITERARVLMRLERYNENEPTRLRLFVKESNFPTRPALTVIHGDNGVAFEPDKGETGRQPDRAIECARWLAEFMWVQGVDTAIHYGKLIDAAGYAGFAGDYDEGTRRWSNRNLLSRAIDAINGKSVLDLQSIMIDRIETPNPGKPKPTIAYALRMRD